MFKASRRHTQLQERAPTVLARPLVSKLITYNVYLIFAIPLIFLLETL